ncbi:MAG TPA: hypothetical protein VGA70_07300 [Longimicrobiales bacterium]
MKRTIIAMCGAALAALLIQPSDAAAWQCGDMEGCGEGYHTNFGSPEGDTSGPHTYCGYCLIGNCHEAGCQQTEQQDLDDLVEAVQQGDDAMALTFAGRLLHRIEVNEARGALQVKSCQGDGLVANIPVSESIRQAVLAQQQED